MTPALARSLILTTASLERDGVPASRVRKMVADQELMVVHRGRYVRRAEWDAAYPETRHLFAVVAADSFRMSDDVVFAFDSAAVAHGLPLFRHRAGAPHICTPHADGVVGRHRAVQRHQIDIAETDRVMIDGIPVTSLERTTYDIIRTTPRETAVACADAALRTVAGDAKRRTYDVEASENWRAALKERIARASGARGIRQARWVADFMDGRAHLPGESISRVYLADLGFAAPRLQVPFPAPRGGTYWIDFGLDDVRAWGEFDGTGKYFDPAMLKGDSSREALRKEKDREDWIRGRSQWRLARWGSAHIASAKSLGSHLAKFGITPLT
jgi:hypothetical protein